MTRYTIIAAEFNQVLVDAMVQIASEEMKSRGLALSKVIRVPGAFETPLIADIELAKPGIGGVVVLGYIEKGETLHGEVMGHVVHTALVQSEIRHRKPVGIGIIGPGATAEQAQVRHVNTAKAAVNALDVMCKILESV